VTPHQDYVSPDSEYYSTPTHILTAVRKVFGGVIDLDPCSDDKANEAVKASKFYTAADDGLAQDNPWSGKVRGRCRVGAKRRKEKRKRGLIKARK
jgi:hypothetical protein